MRVLVAAVLACSACYTPSPQAGSPCMRDHDCPSSLVCSPATNTCERTSADPDVDAQPIDAHLVDGCTPTREICGNGIDEDCDAIDPACLANDVGAGAVDVTAGGTFTADALLARDDVAADGCGEGGGRDVFFQVDLTAPQVYYADTFGSNFDTVIRVFERPCAMVGGGGNAKACVDDACGGTQGQIAVSLPAGKSCIVIDQRAGAELGGNVTLHVVKGGRDGKPLATGVQTTTSDTCSATNASEPLDMNCDGPGAGGKGVLLHDLPEPDPQARRRPLPCPELGRRALRQARHRRAARLQRRLVRQRTDDRERADHRRAALLPVRRRLRSDVLRHVLARYEPAPVTDYFGRVTIRCACLFAST